MKKAILSTLAYGDIFDWPMKEDEIRQWLIVENGKWKMENGKFKENLKKLVKEKKCKTKDDFYFLPGREKIILQRKKRAIYSPKKIEKAQKITQFLKFIPWIKLIGVTGAVACNNAKKEDDIDLFLITAQGRLWLTRGLVVLILRLLGVYRRPDKISDMICPNMFLDETGLTLPKSDRNLFVAHELLQMQPLYNKEQTWEKLLQVNSWAKRYLPNAKQLTIDNGQWEKEKIINYQLSTINYLERFARRLQLWYMKPRRTTEVIGKTMIRFHPQDISRRVLSEYQKRTKSLGISGS